MPSTQRTGYLLLVDDHDDGRELLGEFLEMNGFSVKSAASAEEALGLLASEGAPSVVVTDLSLGDMSGAELARKIRETPATAKVPIVAATGHSGFEDTDGLFAAVLVKPVPLASLVDTLDQAMKAAS